MQYNRQSERTLTILSTCIRICVNTEMSDKMDFDIVFNNKGTFFAAGVMGFFVNVAGFLVIQTSGSVSLKVVLQYIFIFIFIFLISIFWNKNKIYIYIYIYIDRWIDRDRDIVSVYTLCIPCMYFPAICFVTAVVFLLLPWRYTSFHFFCVYCGRAVVCMIRYSMNSSYMLLSYL